MILLDTSVLIEVVRRKDKVETLFYRLAATSKETLAISSVTVYEFRNGMTPINADICERLLSRLVVLPFDATAARSASMIYHTLKTQSKLIEIADILIASTALTHDISLATLNARHFQRITDLRLHVF